MFTADVSLLNLVVAFGALGMALSLGNPNAVVRKMRGDSREVGVAEAIRSFVKHLQNLGNPDLQIVEFSGLASADKVVADAPCKLFALYIKKPQGSSTAAWLKGSDHASAAAANGDLVVKLAGTGGGGRAYCPVFHDGLPMATGLTLGAHTANNGNTKSNAADAPTGFAVIGAA